MKVEDVIRAYVAQRDEMRAKKAEYDKDLAERKEKLEKLEGWLLRQAQAQGVNGFNTSFGICYKSPTVSATIIDRDAAIRFASEHNNWAMLTLSANKQVVKQLIETEGAVPPGVKYVVIDGMSVRKPGAA